MGMMELQDGIEAIKAGHVGVGLRMLRAGLRDGQIPDAARCIALMWLSDYSSEKAQRLDYAREAVAADPSNTDAQARLNRLMADDLPRPTPPTATNTLSAPPTQPQPQQPTQQYPTQQPTQYPQPQQPTQYPQPQQPTQYPQPQQPTQYPTQQPTQYPQPQQPMYPPQPNYGAQTPPQGMPAYGYPPMGGGQPPYYGAQTTPPTEMQLTSVAVIGGPNGAGSGFFITADGVLATARRCVGGREQVTVELNQGRQVAGHVLRSFPEYDVAFVKVDVRVKVLPITAAGYIADNLPMIAWAYGHEPFALRQRPTKALLQSYWIPTNVDRDLDAGGGPLLDERNNLVGMLTNNASRSSAFRFGLHIVEVLHLWEQHHQTTRATVNFKTTYCASCGAISRALDIHSFYCETCGSTLTQAQEIARYHVPEAELLYGETNVLPCPYCASRAGYHQNACLRCGQRIKI
jgi:hypothetical protein